MSIQYQKEKKGLDGDAALKPARNRVNDRLPTVVAGRQQGSQLVLTWLRLSSEIRGVQGSPGPAWDAGLTQAGAQLRRAIHV